MLRIFDTSTFVQGEARLAIENYVALTIASIKREADVAQGSPKTLFHYTGTSGFCGIVQSGNIRATHLAYMNDSSEYQHGVTLLHEAVSDERKKNSDPIARSLFDCMLPQLEPLPVWDLPPIFVACLSATPDSLSQWRAYGGGEGGIALGFERARLEQAIVGINAALAPVIYDNAKKRQIVHQMVQWAIAEFQKLRSRQPSDDIRQLAKSWTETLFAYAAQVAPLFKDEAFAEEREWRLLYGPRYKTEICVAAKGPRLTSFIDIGLGKPPQIPSGWEPGDPARKRKLPNCLPLKEVWFGPGRVQELTRLAAKVLLENGVYPDGVKLELSRVPFRSI
jgi:hypothetical protein